MSYNKPMVIIEKDIEMEIGKILKKDGISSLFIVDGYSSVKSSGLYSKILDELKSKEIRVSESSEAHAVLAVGGGTAITEAYKISDTYKLPLYIIPTSPITGLRPDSDVKALLIDPELTFTYPPNFTAYSTAIIYANIVEGIIQKDLDPKLIDDLKEYTELVLRDPYSYEARKNYIELALTAGDRRDSSPVHFIVNALTEALGVVYGAGIAIILPAWLKWSKSELKNPERWLHSLGCPIRFSEYNIDKTSFNKILEHIKDDNKYTKSVVKEILEIAEDY